MKRILCTLWNIWFQPEPVAVLDISDSMGQLTVDANAGDSAGGPAMKEVKPKKPSKAQKRRVMYLYETKFDY